ncbi:MAG: iron donor protein CyaY [Kofleriaceae bacterium]
MPTPTPDPSATSPIGDLHAVDDATFDEVSRAELRHLEDALADVDPDDVEVSVSDGILRLDLRGGTRVVINTHRAARQIWMAAVSTAWHFDREEDGTWRARRSGEALRETLAALLRERAGVQVSL